MIRAFTFICLIVMVMGQCSNPNQNGLQCSTDCRSRGYCSNNQWYLVDNCPLNLVCTGTPPTVSCQLNAPCDTLPQPSSVRCSESTLGHYIPNIMDPSCSTYYTCTATTESPIIEHCPSGMTFDFCTTRCQATVTCPTESPCSTSLTILSSNRRLAYGCTRDGDTVTLMTWLACDTGAFDSNGHCVSFADYNCHATGICTGAGNIPIPGTNCEYRKCYVDGTHDDIPCSSGSHYDDTVKKCTVGACTQL